LIDSINAYFNRIKLSVSSKSCCSWVRDLTVHKEIYTLPARNRFVSFTWCKKSPVYSTKLKTWKLVIFYYNHCRASDKNKFNRWTIHLQRLTEDSQDARRNNHPRCTVCHYTKQIFVFFYFNTKIVHCMNKSNTGL